MDFGSELEEGDELVTTGLTSRDNWQLSSIFQVDTLTNHATKINDTCLGDK